MIEKLLLIGLLCVLTGCNHSKEMSGGPNNSTETPSQSLSTESANELSDESKQVIVPVQYEPFEITRAKLSPVQSENINKTYSETTIKNGSILLYSNNGNEHDIIASIKTMTKNLQIDGLVGYDDPSGIQISEPVFNGVSLVKIEGFVGAAAPITQYLYIENNEPKSYWQTESHVVEQDVDGDGQTEFVATAGGTIPETTIYKFSTSSKDEAANLNKIMNGSVIFIQNNQFDVYYGPDKKAEHYSLTVKGMEFTSYIN